MLLRHFFDILLRAWITTTITKSGQGVRAVGYRFVIHKIYKLEAFEDTAIYDAAAQACEARSARLVRVKSQEINEALKPLISAGAHYFIGLRQTHDNSLNSWTWNDGTNISLTLQTGYQNWYEHEPTHLREQCVAARASNEYLEKGEWLDLYCNTQRRYICQSNVIQMNSPKSTITVIQGDVITVSLVMKTYGGLLTVEAYKDSNTPEVIQRNVGNETVQFIINSADLPTSGFYTFRAFPSSSGTPMETVKLYTLLHVPVSIPNTSQQSISSPNANGVNQVTCSANGNPTPGVYWQRNGVNISTSQGTNAHVTQTRGEGIARLYIDKALRKDAGTYTCVAVNYVGEEGIKKTKSAEITLTVYGKPTILSHEVDNCSVRGKINITWRADEASTYLNHKYEVSDFKQSQKHDLLKPYKGDQHLEIKDLNPGTLYTIKIFACLDDPCTNEILNNKVTATTGTGLPSRITSDVKLQMSNNNSSDQCSVSWMKTAAAIAEKFEVTISWSLVNIPLYIKTRNGSTIHTVPSKDLKFDWEAKPNRKYVAEVAAANCAGSGEKSVAVGNCRTKPKEPSYIFSPNVTEAANDKGRLGLVLRIADDSGGPISCYFVLVKAGDPAKEELTLNSLENAQVSDTNPRDEEMYIALAIPRQLITKEVYEIELGDSKISTCNLQRVEMNDRIMIGRNQPLIDGLEYSITVTTSSLTEEGIVLKSSSPTHILYKDSTANPPIVIIIISVLATIVIVVVVAVVVLCCVRARKQKAQTPAETVAQDINVHVYEEVNNPEPQVLEGEYELPNPPPATSPPAGNPAYKNYDIASTRRANNVPADSNNQAYENLRGESAV